MKKELKSGILSADKMANHRPINRPTVGGANVIAVLGISTANHFVFVHAMKTVLIPISHRKEYAKTYRY